MKRVLLAAILILGLVGIAAPAAHATTGTPYLATEPAVGDCIGNFIVELADTGDGLVIWNTASSSYWHITPVGATLPLPLNTTDEYEFCYSGSSEWTIQNDINGLWLAGIDSNNNPVVQATATGGGAHEVMYIECNNATSSDTTFELAYAYDSGAVITSYSMADGYYLALTPSGDFSGDIMDEGHGSAKLCS